MLTLDTHPAVDELRKEIDEVGERVEKFSLADAIRLGASKTDQSYNWGNEENACAMSAAAIACKAHGLA